MNFRTVIIIIHKNSYFLKSFIYPLSFNFTLNSMMSFSFSHESSGMFNPREFGKTYFNKIESFFMWFFNAQNLYQIHTLRRNKTISSSWVGVNEHHLSKFKYRNEYLDMKFHALNRCNYSKLWRWNK